MALICNIVQAEVQQVVQQKRELWEVYLDNERYIESGSAYFSQAFAEALCLVSDIELHNPGGARLRVQSMAFLLEHALKQYEAAAEFESRTGLNEYHERTLREAGLDFKGVRQVLSEAQRRDFIRGDDERIETLAGTFDRMGYSGLMSLYIDRVQELHDLTVAVGAGEKLGDDAVQWQELGWKLTTLFAQALEVGKSIAILNTLTFRLPAGALASDASLSS